MSGIRLERASSRVCAGEAAPPLCADFGVSAALEASPEEESASQSQHQPGAEPPKVHALPPPPPPPLPRGKGGGDICGSLPGSSSCAILAAGKERL